MANSDHIRLLRLGVDEWNEWRTLNPHTVPDFEDAALRGIELGDRVNLQNANFSFSDLSSAVLYGADLRKARLQGASLTGTNLSRVILDGADLRGANLVHADFHRALMDDVDLRNANLNGARLDVISCRRTKFHGANLHGVYYECSPVGLQVCGTSILALAEAEGLDRLAPESGSFLDRFIADAFHYAHTLNSPVTIEVHSDVGVETVTFDKAYDDTYGAVANALARISVLNRLYSRYPDHPGLVVAASTVNDQLIAFLKTHPQELRHVPWRTFEELVAELLTGFGWDVQLTRPSKDGGYDIFGIYKDEAGIRHSWIIECKKWAQERRVGIEIARALYQVKGELRVGGALLATTSSFTQGVQAFKSSRYDFELRDYHAIIDWINAYKK